MHKIILFGKGFPVLLRIIILFDCLFFFLVLRPSAGLPKGVHGPGRPILEPYPHASTTVWMVIRVHNRSADGRADTHMAFTPCFTDIDQVMLCISHLSDRLRGIRSVPLSSLRKAYEKRRIFSFLCHKLCAVSCGTNKLAAMSWIKLNVV